jgi:hypothetical protein
MSRQPRVICPICGNEGIPTKDHLPPRCLFSTPPPLDLRTVKVCRNCNHGASRDDEYFRVVLAHRENVDQSADGKTIFEAVQRSLAKPEAEGLAKMFEQSVRVFEIQTPAGIYLGRKSGYVVHWPRIERVMNWIVRGLYYSDMKTILPPTYKVTCWDSAMLESQPTELKEKLVDMAKFVIAKGRSDKIGDVFSYAFSTTDEDPGRSFWVMLFYRTIVFLCRTMPAKSGPPDRGARQGLIDE